MRSPMHVDSTRSSCSGRPNNASRDAFCWQTLGQMGLENKRMNNGELLDGRCAL